MIVVRLIEACSHSAGRLRAAARRVDSPALWTCTSTRGRSCSAATASPCRRGVSRRARPRPRAAADELGGPVVVKAQVLTGGRGKAGGIKLAESAGDAEARAAEILGLDIRGHIVAQALGRAGLGHRSASTTSRSRSTGARRSRSSCSRRRAGSTSRRSRRRARRRSSASTSTRSRATTPGRGAGSSTRRASRTRRAEADRGDRREALRGLRRLRGDALRDQPADRDARGRGARARLEVHGGRQRALPPSGRSPRCATSPPPIRSRRSRARRA